MDEDERHINLHATPEMMAGVYANFANVSHSDYEFSITFVRLDHESEEPGEMNGVVVSRVNLSTRFMKELVDAMTDNYSKWLPGGEHQEPAGGAGARPGAAGLTGAPRLARRTARPERAAGRRSSRPPPSLSTSLAAGARTGVRLAPPAASQNGQAGSAFRLLFALHLGRFPALPPGCRSARMTRPVLPRSLDPIAGAACGPPGGTVAIPSHVFRRTHWTSTKAKCSGST